MSLASTVHVFSYGSYMNPTVLSEAGLAPAREHGFPGWYIERLQSYGGGS